MKTLLNIVSLSLALGFATSLSAQRANQPILNKTYEKADNVKSISSMKTGDRYALVCRMTDTVTIKEITDDKEAAALCHDGGSVHCNSCKKKYTIKSVGPRPDSSPESTKVTIVDADGKECMYIVPIKN